MCGIAGFLNNPTADSVSTLGDMLTLIAHRGPDAAGGFVDNTAAIGSVRLSIVDIEGGSQPAVNETRDVAVVFNGEIFNYLELRSRLVEQGVHFKTRSEVELILQLYLLQDKAVFESLEGQFAIAIWDARIDRLLLARDRVGIRPLFWSQVNGTFAFASEIKSFLALPGFEHRLDKKALLQTLKFWTVVGNRSAFEGVQQIPPGHFLSVENNGAQLSRYWDNLSPFMAEPLKLNSDEEYVDLFRETLIDSIDRQCMSEVEVGSYLSGGLDSTVIATGLGKILGHKGLRTYSVEFEDAEYDESEAQRQVVEKNSFQHTSVRIQDGDIASVFPSVVYHAETPIFRSAPAPLFHLSSKVHDDGIKVVQTGEGADEILLGYDLFREVAIRRFWSRQPDSNWRGHLMRRLYAYLPQYRNPRYFNLILDFYRSTLQDSSPHYAMAVRWNNADAFSLYLHPDMQNLANTYDPVADLDSWLPKRYEDGDDIMRAQIIEMQTLLANYLLSSQGDRMSMAHSVEGRYPYLDEKFMALSGRLPRSLKLRGLKDKFILREAFSDVVPETIRRRPKIAYQAPDISGFVTDGKFPDYVEDLMSPSRINSVGIFDIEQVQRLMQKAKNYNLSRVGYRDNMAFIIVLSTMLLDDLYVRGNARSDMIINNKLHLNVIRG